MDECKTTVIEGIRYHAHADFCEHLFPGVSEEIKEAYEAGKDKALNGANTENCNMSHFRTKEQMRAWELGTKASVTP